MLIRSVRSAICTSGEPVSVSWRRYSVIVVEVSGIVRFVLFRPTGRRDRGYRLLARQNRSREGGDRRAYHSLAGFEHPADRLDVAVHGRHQGVDRLEAFLGPDPVDEPDRGRLTVEIAMEGAQVVLEQQGGLDGVT